ncbi:hypothetical protein SLS53_008885 [Cytospora paraplurivora]|uniref:Uncharacterized protein n=1 Tax=Cytospora paraplurivora TaxID=2898453 RepID=A0AAN9TX14_9PEZI
MATATAPIAIPAVAPVDSPEPELLPVPEDPEPDPAEPPLLLVPDVGEAPAAVKSVDLWSRATRSAETVKMASPDTDMAVESTLIQVSWTAASGPKLKAVVDDGHSDKPLTIIVFGEPSADEHSWNNHYANTYVGQQWAVVSSSSPVGVRTSSNAVDHPLGQLRPGEYKYVLSSAPGMGG